MNKNLIITGRDFNCSLEVSKILSGELFTMLLNQVELFDFDHVPRTIREVIEANGREYVESELRSILLMELDFENTIMVCPLSFVGYSKDLLGKLKERNLIVLLTPGRGGESGQISEPTQASETAETAQSENPFTATPANAEEFEEILRSQGVDIEICTNNLSSSQITRKILDKLNNF